jgi:SAM-dependent methyltransferase
VRTGTVIPRPKGEASYGAKPGKGKTGHVNEVGKRMYRLVKKVRARLFAGTPCDWQVYHHVVASHLQPGMTVLDVGCGKGNISPFPWENHPKVTLIGLDPDPAAERNASLHRFVLLKNEAHWPVADGSVDVVIARYVLEHVASPTALFDNVRRVLKPGGRFIFLTPNKYHPAMIASRHLPHALKTRILARTAGIDDDDVFVAHYRLNTSRKLREEAGQHGFFIEHLATKEFHPVGYIDFSVIGFLIACGYYLALKGTGLEPFLGQSIIGVFRLEPG